MSKPSGSLMSGEMPKPTRMRVMLTAIPMGYEPSANPDTKLPPTANGEGKI